MVEQWSPKPRAEGSSPSAPARKETDAERCPFFAETNLEPRHAERVEGCGSPVETSAYEVCRSTDRAGRRDQVLLPLPSAINPNFITVIGDAFGFIVFIETI